MEENKISKDEKGTKIRRYPRNVSAQKNSKKDNSNAQKGNQIIKNPKENKSNRNAKNSLKKTMNNQKKSIVKKEANPIVKLERRDMVKISEKPLAIKEDFSFKKDNLKIIPLGGIEEIGKNITVFEYGNDIVLVDCGVAFPEEDMLGIDLVIPDFTYLERNKEKIRGLVITHGHEDHIGSIAYLLKQMNIPIYATKLTIGLISNKLEEHKLLKSAKLHVVKQGQTIVLGKIRVEFKKLS